MRNVCPRFNATTVALVWLFALGCTDDDDGRRVDASSIPTGGSQDASGTDTAGTDASKSTPDAGSIAAQGDAARDSTSASLNVLYASFNGTLVRIDPDTAMGTAVGKLRNKADEAQAFTDVVMHWSGAANTALAVLDYANPRLGTVDLCTGLVTVGAVITRAASPNLVVEGLALHPNGTWYTSAGNPASRLSPISTNLGTLNPTTGAITDLGTAVATVQNDVDGLFFRGETLFGFDVATATNRMDVFTLNTATGANTNVLTPTYAANLVPLRIAFDASRNKAFAWRAGDRQLVEISLSENMVRPIGPTHPANLYANQPARGFFVAPAATCP